MFSEEKQKRTERQELDAKKLEIRNLQRRLNNAQHTYQSNCNELVNMQRERFEKDIIARQEECCDYWEKEIEKVEGKVFLVCLESGLNEEKAWE